MHQLLIALPLPATIKKQLERVCIGLPNASWTQPHDLHITLISLDNIDGNVLIDIQEKLDTIHFPSFTLFIEGIETVYRKGETGNIYAKTSFGSEISQLSKIIETKLSEIPIILEKNKIKPVINLGSFNKIEAKNLAAYLEANSSFSSPPFKVDTLILFESRATAKHHIIYLELSRHSITGTPPYTLFRNKKY